jgi:hypothetical protein
MRARQQNNLDLPDSNEARVHWCLTHGRDCTALQVARKEVAVEQLDARSPSLESSPAVGSIRKGTRSVTILRRGGKARKQQASNASVPNQEHPEAAHVKEKAQNECAVRPTTVYSCRENVCQASHGWSPLLASRGFQSSLKRTLYSEKCPREQFHPISRL